MKIKSRWVLSAVIITSSALASGMASAQEKDRGADSLAPATHAVELTLGTGYAQGLGDIGSSQPTLTDVGQAGGALQAGVGYRIIPQLALGVYGSYGMFGRGDQVDRSATVSTATAGV